MGPDRTLQARFIRRPAGPAVDVFRNHPAETGPDRTVGVSFSSICQNRTALFRNLAIPQPILIVVRSGRKTVEIDGRVLKAEAGEAIAISGGVMADVRNEAPAGEPYRSDIIVWTDYPAPRVTAPVLASNGVFAMPEPLRVHLDRLRNDAADLPPAILNHRAEEIAIWLASFGIGLAMPDQPRLSFVLRALIAQAPAQDWCIADMLAALAARGLATSEASLRRRLLAEGTSFTALVIETRLMLALERLQSTRQSITQIAFDVGYESASRFAMRFRARFGLSPSEIRGVARAGKGRSAI